MEAQLVEYDLADALEAEAREARRQADALALRTKADRAAQDAANAAAAAQADRTLAEAWQSRRAYPPAGDPGRRQPGRKGQKL